MIDEAARLAAAVDQAKMPAGADRAALAAGVADAVSIFRRDAAEPRAAELRAELSRLLAISERNPDQLPTAMDALSPGARSWLATRRDALLRPGRALLMPGPGVPAAVAARTIVMLLVAGFEVAPDRNRPGGKKSRLFIKVKLRMSPARAGAPKKESILTLVMWLQIAWLDATGEPPSATAHHDNKGPFCRFVESVLTIVSPYNKNTAYYINKLHSRQKKLHSRQKSPVRRFLLKYELPRND